MVRTLQREDLHMFLRSVVLAQGGLLPFLQQGVTYHAVRGDKIKAMFDFVAFSIRHCPRRLPS